MLDPGKVSARHWRELRELTRRGLRSEADREAHQLLQAAVLYQAHSLPHLGPFLHEKWRLPPQLPIHGVYAGAEDDDLLPGGFPHPNEMIGQMHLASAAVRLPVALEKTIAVNTKAELPFRIAPELWNGSSWRRGGLSRLFSAVRDLGHCGDGPFGATRDERLRRAMVIVIVLRDDFGHGEAGDPGATGNQNTRDYVTYRKDVLDDLHACRIVEAQQDIVGWAIEHLR